MLSDYATPQSVKSNGNPTSDLALKICDPHRGADKFWGFYANNRCDVGTMANYVNY